MHFSGSCCSLFLGRFEAQAADQDRIAKTCAQIINGVFRQRRAVIDKIGGIGLIGGGKGADADAEQPKLRAIGFAFEQRPGGAKDLARQLRR